MTDKERILKAIKQKQQDVWPTDTGKMAPASVPNNLEQGWLNALTWMEKYINSLPAEQPSEELEDEIYNYWRNELTTEDIVTISKDDFIFHATHFAKWQKQQMMRSAIDGCYIKRNKYTKENVLNGLSVTCNAIQKFKDGDKVKVIIAKEDEQ